MWRTSCKITWCMQFRRSDLINKAAWPWVIKKIKRSCKGQYWNSPRFWDHPCTVTIWCTHFLSSYCVHKAIWLRVRLKVQNGHTKINIKLGKYFDVVVPCKVTWCRWIQELSHLDWPWASLKVQKGDKKVNIELIYFDMENIAINLQHETGNIWRIITFTRCCRMPAAYRAEGYKTESKCQVHWPLNLHETVSKCLLCNIGIDIDGVAVTRSLDLWQMPYWCEANNEVFHRDSMVMYVLFQDMVYVKT